MFCEASRPHPQIFLGASSYLKRESTLRKIRRSVDNDHPRGFIPRKTHGPNAGEMYLYDNKTTDTGEPGSKIRPELMAMAAADRLPSISKDSSSQYTQELEARQKKRAAEKQKKLDEKRRAFQKRKISLSWSFILKMTEINPDDISENDHVSVIYLVQWFGELILRQNKIKRNFRNHQNDVFCSTFTTPLSYPACLKLILLSDLGPIWDFRFVRFRDKMVSNHSEKEKHGRMYCVKSGVLKKDDM